MATASPQIIRVLGWNVENYGRSKHDHPSGLALIEFIAGVIADGKYDIAAFCEIRSNYGDRIGKALVNELAKSGAGWKHKASEQFCDRRKEQYLFVWNQTKFGATPPQFFYSFPAPGGGKLGFSKQIAKHRPPFLAEFEVVTPQNKKTPFRVAMMHSPNPSEKAGVRGAGKSLALVPQFAEPGISVLIGDFNVKLISNAQQHGSNGFEAFGDLVTKSGFAQLLDDFPTSLKQANSAVVAMTKTDCANEPYDQIFLKAVEPNKNLRPLQDVFDTNGHPAGVENLVEDCVVSGTNASARLANLHTWAFGNAVSGFTTMEDAFQTYRVVVSDHFPVSVDVTVQ